MLCFSKSVHLESKIFFCRFTFLLFLSCRRKRPLKHACTHISIHIFFALPKAVDNNSSMIFPVTIKIPIYFWVSLFKLGINGFGMYIKAITNEEDSCVPLQVHITTKRRCTEWAMLTLEIQNSKYKIPRLNILVWWGNPGVYTASQLE